MTRFRCTRTKVAVADSIKFNIYIPSTIDASLLFLRFQWQPRSNSDFFVLHIADLIASRNLTLKYAFVEAAEDRRCVWRVENDESFMTGKVTSSAISITLLTLHL